MPRNFLSDMEISMISLVRAGANRKEIVYKNETFEELRYIEITKHNDELGVVYGIVYSPDEEDTQGDIATAKEIRKAAYNFMKTASIAKAVDVEHDLEPVDAFICESYIVRKGDEYFPEDEGAWAVGIKLEDDDLISSVKKGDIAALSMYGSAKREPNDDKGIGLGEAIKKAIADGFKEIFTKEENVAKEKKDDVKKDEETIADIVKSVMEGVKAPMEDLTKKLDDLQKEVGTLKNEVAKSRQNEDVNKKDETPSGGIL